MKRVPMLGWMIINVVERSNIWLMQHLFKIFTDTLVMSACPYKKTWRNRYLKAQTYLYAGEFLRASRAIWQVAVKSTKAQSERDQSWPLDVFTHLVAYPLGALFFFSSPNPIARWIPKDKWKYNVLCQVTWQVSNERISWRNPGLNSDCTGARSSLILFHCNSNRNS